MSTSASPTTTMSGMSMATPTSNATKLTTMMDMSTSAMTFFTSTTTPLYSSSWTPNTAGQYAGTCIFLIALATTFRALLATRINLFQILAAVKYRRGGGMGYPYTSDAKSSIRPWRANEAVILASVDVVLAGIGYLLMIAVMTMNVGYFLSILGGVFLGSVVFGHFMAHSAAH